MVDHRLITPVLQYSVASKVHISDDFQFYMVINYCNSCFFSNFTNTGRIKSQNLIPVKIQFAIKGLGNTSRTLGKCKNAKFKCSKFLHLKLQN